MQIIDWLIIGVYFAGSFAVGAVFARRAGRSTSEFFLGGRTMAWWLAGLSMVATTFAADTPLAVTELVATHGVAGNWLWWNMAIGGMLTVFFFARLWRRAGVLTDLEVIELRYSGPPAAFLRGFRAVWLGLLMNAVIMGWVNVAMGSVLAGMFGIPAAQVTLYIAGAMLLTALYSSLSGLWGVAVTDAVQFLLAMAGCIVLAVLVLQAPQVGGVAGLQAQLPAATLRMLPVVGGAADAAGGVLALSAGAFFAYVGMQWWASWYPGAEPGGGGYIAQRMMSTRNEKHAVLSVLFFQIAHYVLRPWPWILVGLATVVLYPDLPAADKKMGYILAMRDFLPAGFRGLMVAAFFAAYMSTIATHLNWGTSYLVNDFWRRFVRRDMNEAQAVRFSRLTTLLLMAASLALTLVIQTVSGAWQFLIECGAGLGLVLILRWYWWRVNAWSEIAATITPAVLYGLLTLWNLGQPEAARITFPATLFIIVPATTIAWVAVTLLTRPTDPAVLDAFFRRVRPTGRGWRPVAARCGGAHRGHFGALAAAWAAGVGLIYTLLFGSGALLFGSAAELAGWTAAAAACALVLWRALARTWKDDGILA